MKQCFVGYGSMYAFIALVGLALPTTAQPPPQGLSMPCEVVNVVDGDTVDVEVKYRLRIRLLDCWAPESRTRDLEEKERGIASAEHLAWHAHGRKGTVFIPMTEDVKRSLTLDRYLGKVWIDGYVQDLSEIQVRSGHATFGR